MARSQGVGGRVRQVVERAGKRIVPVRRRSTSPTAGTATPAAGATKKTVTHKAVGKKAVSQKAVAKKAPPKKVAGKQAPAKKAVGKQTAAKKVPAKQAPAKKAVGKQAAAKTPVKKVSATKALAKSAASATKASTDTAAAKRAPAKKAPAKAAPAKKAPAKKAPAKKAPAKKAPVTKAPAKKSPAKKSAARLAVRVDESPWTTAELAEVKGQLQRDVRRLREEIARAEAELNELLRDSGEGSGDDQADAGSKTFEREHEMSMANNARDLLLQIEHALARIADGSYGMCESCGQPIGKARLQAFPRATLCVSCKQREERR